MVAKMGREGVRTELGCVWDSGSSTLCFVGHERYFAYYYYFAYGKASGGLLRARRTNPGEG